MGIKDLFQKPWSGRQSKALAPVEPVVPVKPPRARENTRFQVVIPENLRNTTLVGFAWRPVQQPYEIVRARGYYQFDGFIHAITNAIVSDVVGKAGIQVVFNNQRWRKLWDDWSWNPSRPYEGFDELQRDALRYMFRDGECFSRFIASPEGFFVQNIDALDLPPDRAYDPPINNARPQAYSSGQAINGIVYDQFRRPIEYRFRAYQGRGGP